MRRTILVGVAVVGAVAVAVAILFGGGFLNGSAAGPSATPIPPVAAADEVVVEGRAVPLRAGEPGATVAGVVSEISVDVGDSVVSGAILLRLDSAEADAAVDAAQAGLDAASARLDQAKAAIDQAVAGVARAKAALAGADAARDLLPSGASSARKRAADAEVDAAQAALDAARAAERGARAAAEAAAADQRHAEAVLASARATQDRHVIRAPFDGTVIAVEHEVGDAVNPGQPLVRLSDGSGWTFESTEVEDAVVSSIMVGAPAKVTLDGLPGVVIDGTVTDVSGYGQERQGDVMYTVVVEPDAAVPDGIRWNMRSTIAISTDT